MNQFSSNAISQRLKRTQDVISPLLGSDDLLVVFCGDTITKPGGLDQKYPFIPHPEYFWLTDRRRSTEALAFSKKEGWIHFHSPLTLTEQLWDGDEPESNVIVDLTSKSLPANELQNWIQKLNPKKIFALGQIERVFEPILIKSKPPESELTLFQESFNSVRRIKDQEEIQLIQEVAKIAKNGYDLLTQFIKPGVSETDIKIAFEAEVLRSGSTGFPYTTIVGSGPNSAVLHAMPTSKKLNNGELVLIDAGAQIKDYCVDITRVFNVNNNWSSQQKDLYGLVFNAQQQAMLAATAGVTWASVHTTAATIITDGLKDLGILVGDTQSLLESGATALFFPHSVGHMVGLRVRDVGGEAGKSPAQCCGIHLRFNLTLQENFIVTIEPGVYFNSRQFQQPNLKSKFKSQINWSTLESWHNIGGVRIEDDILITKKEPLNLTSAIAKVLPNKANFYP
jgi:Xaa-Pro dipeptidase